MRKTLLLTTVIILAFSLVFAWAGDKKDQVEKKITATSNTHAPQVDDVKEQKAPEVAPAEQPAVVPEAKAKFIDPNDERVAKADEELYLQKQNGAFKPVEQVEEVNTVVKAKAKEVKAEEEKAVRIISEHELLKIKASEMGVSVEELLHKESIVPLTPPGLTTATGDNCADPITLTIPADLPFVDQDQATCGRGNSDSTSCMGNYDGGEDIVYEITVTADTYVNFIFDPKGTIWTGFALAAECPPVTCIFNNTSASGSERSQDGVLLEATVGTYYLMIDTYPDPDCIPDFDLTIEEYTAPTGRCCDYTDPPNPVCTDGVEEADCDGAAMTWVEGLLCSTDPCPSYIGNDCAYPIVITDADLPYSETGQTTCMRGNTYSETCLGNYDNDEDILYAFTNTSGADIFIDVEVTNATAAYLGILADTLCPGGSSCLDYETGYYGSYDISLEIVPVNAGQTVYIMVDNYEEGCFDFDFDITQYLVPTGRCCNYDTDPDNPTCTDAMEEDDCVASGTDVSWVEDYDCTTNPCPVPPVNDDCADAMTVVPDVEYTVDNTRATDDGDGGEDIRHNVWYCYTATLTGTAQIRLCDSDFDTELAVYEGCNCDAGMASRMLAYNDDNSTVCGSGGRSALDLDITLGESYLIEAGTYSSYTTFGDIVLIIEETAAPVEGDSIENAYTIPSLPYSDAGNTSAFTDNYVGSCGTHVSAPDVVYAYTATVDTFIDISLCGSSYDTRLYVYENDTSTEVACDDDGCPSVTTTTRSWINALYVTSGDTYYFVIDGYSSNSGDYVIDVDFADPPALGDACSNPIDITAFPYTFADNSCNYTNKVRYDGPDVIWRFTLAAAARLQFSLCNSDSVFYDNLFLHEDGTCGGDYLTYEYDGCASSAMTEFTYDLGAGTYYLVLDGSSSTPNCGEFQLDIAEIVIPTGRCCYYDTNPADPYSPICVDAITEVDCDALIDTFSGTWTEGLDCTSDPCPVPVDFTGTETFDDAVNSFYNYSMADDAAWEWTATYGNPAPGMYHNDTYVECDDYLVSNGSYTVPDVEMISLYFDQDCNYPTYYQLHEVLVSTDFAGDPSTATWVTLYEGFGDEAWTTMSFSLEAYRGQDVNFAFHYMGNGDTEWYIDNVKVQIPPTGRCCDYTADINNPVCTDDVYADACAGELMTWLEAGTCSTDPCPVPPANDDCANAIDVTGTYPVSGTGTTIMAQPDCPDSLDEFRAVWYKFDLAYAYNNVTITMCGDDTDIDTVGIILTDDCVCDDYILATGYDFDTTYCSTGYTGVQLYINYLPAGTYYWPAKMTDANGEGMDFSYTIDVVEYVPLPGDMCENALTVDAMPFTSDTLNTCNYGDFCDISGLNSSEIIFEWVVPAEYVYTVSLCDSITDYDTKIAIYADECCTGPETYYAYNDDACGTASEITTTFFPGTYYVVVDGYDGDCGLTILDISEFGEPPVGACCYGDFYNQSCADATEFECIDTYAGFSWVEGDSCATAECPSYGAFNSDVTAIDDSVDAVGPGNVKTQVINISNTGADTLTFTANAIIDPPTPAVGLSSAQFTTLSGIYNDVNLQKGDPLDRAQGLKFQQSLLADYTGFETFDSNIGEFTAYNVDTGDTTTWYWYDSDGNPAGCARIDYNSYNAEDDYLISNGTFTVPDVDDVALTFDQRDVFTYGLYYNTHEVLISLDFAGDPATATWVQLYEDDAQSTWETISISMETYRGDAVNIAFHYIGDDADDWMVDNVYIGTPQTGRCCYGSIYEPDCVDGVTLDSCDALSGIFTAEIDCSTPCEYWPHCDDDALVGQYPDMETWTGGTADAGVSLKRYDSYAGAYGLIEEVTFWGFDRWHDGTSWVECDEEPMDFEIQFWTDDAGIPGTLVYSESLSINPEAYTWDLSGRTLKEFHAVLNTAVELDNGWISIQGISINDPDCWFLWLSSTDGDDQSLTDDGTGLAVEAFDLNFCFNGTYQAPWLTIDVDEGEIAAGDPAIAITARMDAEFLSCGNTYTGSINFTSNDPQVPTYSVPVSFTTDCGPNGYEYLPGDANMAAGAWPPNVIGADVTYLVNYFRAIASPCLLGGYYASGDANGDCLVIGADVTYLVQYFRGANTIKYCGDDVGEDDYTPAWLNTGELPPSAPAGWPNCE